MFNAEPFAPAFNLMGGIAPANLVIEDEHATGAGACGRQQRARGQFHQREDQRRDGNHQQHTTNAEACARGIGGKRFAHQNWK